MALEGAEAVRVKEEPEWESETAARAGLHTDTQEPGAQAGHMENEVKKEPGGHKQEASARIGLHIDTQDIEHRVKEEPGATEEGACGVSAEAARASLYKDHTVKDELVVGPEEMHRPKVGLVHPASLSTAERSAVAGRACSVRLEHMHVDLKRRACSIGPHTYKFRSCPNSQRDTNTRKKRKISKNKISNSPEQTDDRVFKTDTLPTPQSPPGWDSLSTPEVLAYIEQLEQEKHALASLKSRQALAQTQEIVSPLAAAPAPLEYSPITPKSEAADMIKALEGSQQLTRARRWRPPKRRDSVVSSLCSENSSLSTQDMKSIRDRRDKNNEAAKRSRMHRKLKEIQMELEADELEEKNKKLRVQAGFLEVMAKRLKDAHLHHAEINALEGSQQLTRARRWRPPKRRDSVVSSLCNENSSLSAQDMKSRDQRDKNKESAKRSRMHMKMKELRLEQEVDELEAQNKKLRVQARILEEMAKKLKK